MDITKDFTTSFNELRKHKVIIMPTLLSLIISAILMLAFFYISGLYEKSAHLIKLSQQYNAEKENYLSQNRNFADKNYTLEFINYIGQTDDYKKGFSNYLEARGYDWKTFLSLINTRNITLFIVILFIILFTSFYLSCMSFALITLNIKNKDLSLSNTINLTHKFLLSLVSLRVLTIFIIGIPIILGIAILIPLYFINGLLGGIFTFFFIIASIAYIIFVALRLFFATPIMFIEEKSAFDSLKFSYNITKLHLKQVFVIGAIIYGISLLMNSFGGSPLYESFVGLLTNGSAAKLIITILIAIIFLILESFISAFENMFFFYAYIDFRKVIK